MVTIGTLVATLLLYVVVPKGFFPVQDTGVILGISEAPQTVSFTSMAERQQKLVELLLQDPAVDNISSFIGVDGTNTTLNSGRIQINLKPLDERKISATEVIRRLQPKLARRGRHSALFAAASGSYGRRSRQPDRVSILAGRSESGRAG
jgi:multidrug efflux pump